MTPQDDRRIRKTSLAADLAADQEEYFRIVDDMFQNSGPLIPDPNWLLAVDESQDSNSYDKNKALNAIRSEDHYARRISKMASLMNAWVGSPKPADPITISKYRRFMGHSDPLLLWRANMETNTGISLSRADLGSMMDLNFLYTFSAPSDRKVTRILEVGGGYGRLAEAAFNVFGRSVQYVIVDAVPASLYYARKYLTRACSEARIASFYDENQLDFSELDIAIIPSWHFEKLNPLAFDICVNIESMQEMNQYHVDYYLNLFNSVACEGATIYLSNAHDYYFRGSYNYPTNWQRLLYANTPRSWSPNHPTEIFRKTTRDCAVTNRMVAALYKYNLWRENDVTDFISRNGPKRLLAPILKSTIKRLALEAWRIVSRRHGLPFS